MRRGRPRRPDPGPPTAGRPGRGRRISTGTVGILDQSSLYRTSDGVLHVVYSKEVGSAGQLAHTSLTTGGTQGATTTILPSAWATMDTSPILMGDGSGGLRVVFGGLRDVNPGFYSDGRMYTATAGSDGASWTLSNQAVGISHSAYGSYGTAGTTLADGTPVAAFPLNSDLTWHVGTGSGADSSYTAPACCLYDATMVNDGGNVWVAWYANGGSAATNGVFVKQILPSVGSTLKAPGSSVGADSLPTGRVALAARSGGGVDAAYCSGYPTCNHITVWQVGTATTATVPSSRYADNIALSPGPGGRLWVAWSDNLPRVKAVRTGVGNLTMGAVRSVGRPTGTSSIYTVAIEGSSARGDVVANIGNGIWHTQVLAGLTLRAKPKAWTHGTAKQVQLTVTDAGAAVAGAKVAVGSKHCTTKATGRCTLSFAASYPKGRHTAKATKSGYAPGTAVLKVR